MIGFVQVALCVYATLETDVPIWICTGFLFTGLVQLAIYFYPLFRR